MFFKLKITKEEKGKSEVFVLICKIVHPRARAQFHTRAAEISRKIPIAAVKQDDLLIPCLNSLFNLIYVPFRKKNIEIECAYKVNVTLTLNTMHNFFRTHYNIQNIESHSTCYNLFVRYKKSQMTHL